MKEELGPNVNRRNFLKGSGSLIATLALTDKAKAQSREELQSDDAYAYHSELNEVATTEIKKLIEKIPGAACFQLTPATWGGMNTRKIIIDLHGDSQYYGFLKLDRPEDITNGTFEEQLRNHFQSDPEMSAVLNEFEKTGKCPAATS